MWRDSTGCSFAAILALSGADPSIHQGRQQGEERGDDGGRGRGRERTDVGVEGAELGRDDAVAGGEGAVPAALEGVPHRRRHHPWGEQKRGGGKERRGGGNKGGGGQEGEVGGGGGGGGGGGPPPMGTDTPKRMELRRSTKCWSAWEDGDIGDRPVGIWGQIARLSNHCFSRSGIFHTIIFVAIITDGVEDY